MATPNEVIHTWHEQRDLFETISLDPQVLPPDVVEGQSAEERELDREEGYDLGEGYTFLSEELMRYSFIDGAGEPLRYPVRLAAAARRFFSSLLGPRLPDRRPCAAACTLRASGR